jgi:hypothetical protein
VRVWELVNHIVGLDRPSSEGERCRVTLIVLGRVKALLKGGFLARWGRKHITLAGTVTDKPPKRFRMRSPRKRLLRARQRTSQPVHDSVTAQSSAQNHCDEKKSATASDCADNQADSAAGGKTQSDTNQVRAVSREQLAAAASQIAKLPRKPLRVWTGWIDGIHYWRGREVQLPDGRVEQVYAVYRGLVGLAVPPNSKFQPYELLVRANQLRVWKNPSAQLLAMPNEASWNGRAIGRQSQPESTAVDRCAQVIVRAVVHANADAPSRLRDGRFRISITRSRGVGIQRIERCHRSSCS